MQIVGLQVENFKRIKAVEIIPQGNTVIISGANGQGKTSILDAIWTALGGAKADKALGTIEPIRDGEKKAVISVDLGDIKVTRKWTSNDSSGFYFTRLREQIRECIGFDYTRMPEGDD